MKKDTAVLVIDVLISGEDDTLYKQDPAEAALVKKAAEVVDAARAAEVPVIFLCDQHIKGVDKELELWGDHGLKGDARPNPELRAGSGALDFIIPKRRYSGFFGTDLDLTLRELGVKKLIAVGEDTNICVLHTLADAWNLGYETEVVADATRTFLVGTQKGALEHMKKCFGTVPVIAAEAAAELA